MKKYSEIMKQLMMLTQFGLSLVTPLLMCLLLCWWLTSRFDIGGWIYIIGFFFGLGGSGMTGYRLYLAEQNRQKKEDERKKKPVSFNRHV